MTADRGAEEICHSACCSFCNSLIIALKPLRGIAVVSSRRHSGHLRSSSKADLASQQLMTTLCSHNRWSRQTQTYFALKLLECYRCQLRLGVGQFFHCVRDLQSKKKTRHGNTPSHDQTIINEWLSNFVSFWRGTLAVCLISGPLRRALFTFVLSLE